MADHATTAHSLPTSDNVKHCQKIMPYASSKSQINACPTLLCSMQLMARHIAKLQPHLPEMNRQPAL